MARGTQLLQLVSDLRAECGHSLSPAAGADVGQSYRTVLRRTQETLWDDYDWPFARVIKSIQMVAEERYYDYPDGLPLEGIQSSWIWWGDRYRTLEYGITLEDYSRYDSDAGDTKDYPMKWDVMWTGDSEQVEVWPIPSLSTSKLWFVGKRVLPAMVDDSDTATLDDKLIVLFAAAEILARQESKDAEMKLKLAQERLSRLRGRVKPGTAAVTIVGGGNKTEVVERLRAPR